MPEKYYFLILIIYDPTDFPADIWLVKAVDETDVRKQLTLAYSEFNEEHYEDTGLYSVKNDVILEFLKVQESNKVRIIELDLFTPSLDVPYLLNN